MFKLKELIKVILISITIGIIVSLPFNLFLAQKWSEYLIMSALIGASIGIVAYLAFSITIMLINYHTFYAFLIIFLIIGTGTSLSVFFLATRDLSLILSFAGLAELAGMTITFISWRKSTKLNSQLSEKKRKITGNLALPTNALPEEQNDGI